MATSKTGSKLSTNSLIALAALVGLLSLVSLILVGRVLLSKIVRNSKVIGAKLTAEHQLDKNIAALPQLASNYQALGNLQGTINSALPTTPDFPALVALSESLAGASGVSLAGVSPGGSNATAATTSAAATTVTTSAASGETDPTPYPITLSVTGTYANILKLLANLQLSTRPLQVTSVSTSGTNSQITASISANAFSFNPPVLANKTKVIK